MNTRVLPNKAAADHVADLVWADVWSVWKDQSDGGKFGYDWYNNSRSFSRIPYGQREIVIRMFSTLSDEIAKMDKLAESAKARGAFVRSRTYSNKLRLTIIGIRYTSDPNRNPHKYDELADRQPA